MGLSTYLFLALAIVIDVIGTSALNASHQFTRLGPTVLMVISYTISFYLLSIALKNMPVGVAYAIWSGAGTALVTIVGVVLFKQKIDLYLLLGIALIISGVVVLNVFSKSSVY